MVDVPFAHGAPKERHVQFSPTAQEEQEKERSLGRLRALWDDSYIAFEMLDKDHDGYISWSDAFYWLRCIGWCCTDKAIDAILRKGCQAVLGKDVGKPLETPRQIPKVTPNGTGTKSSPVGTSKSSPLNSSSQDAQHSSLKGTTEATGDSNANREENENLRATQESGTSSPDRKTPKTLESKTPMKSEKREKTPENKDKSETDLDKSLERTPNDIARSPDETDGFARDTDLSELIVNNVNNSSPEGVQNGKVLEKRATVALLLEGDKSALYRESMHENRLLSPNPPASDLNQTVDKSSSKMKQGNSFTDTISSEAPYQNPTDSIRFSIQDLQIIATTFGHNSSGITKHNMNKGISTEENQKSEISRKEGNNILKPGTSNNTLSVLNNTPHNNTPSMLSRSVSPVCLQQSTNTSKGTSSGTPKKSKKNEVSPSRKLDTPASGDIDMCAVDALNPIGDSISENLQRLFEVVAEGKLEIDRAKLRDLMTNTAEPIAGEDFDELLDLIGFHTYEQIPVKLLSENLATKIRTPPCVPTQRSRFA